MHFLIIVHSLRFCLTESTSCTFIFSTIREQFGSETFTGDAKRVAIVRPKSHFMNPKLKVLQKAVQNLKN
jgi:hypothetical protein